MLPFCTIREGVIVMKKLCSIVLSIVLLIAISIGFAGCGTDDGEVDFEQSTESSMVVIEKRLMPSGSGEGNTRYYICYDKETKVMYLVITKYEAGVAISPLLNPDGSPRIYKEK